MDNKPITPAECRELCERLGIPYHEWVQVTAETRDCYAMGNCSCGKWIDFPRWRISEHCRKANPDFHDARVPLRLVMERKDWKEFASWSNGLYYPPEHGFIEPDQFLISVGLVTDTTGQFAKLLLEWLRGSDEMDAETLGLLKELQDVFPVDWSVGDRFIIPTTMKVFTLTSPKDLPLPVGTLFVPYLYSRDPERPERGLWGMCKRLENLQKVTEASWHCSVWDEWYHGMVVFQGKTPYLALLKAIKWQEEQKKGGRR